MKLMKQMMRKGFLAISILGFVSLRQVEAVSESEDSIVSYRVYAGSVLDD